MNNQLASTLLSSTKLRSSELDFVRGGINHLDGVVSSFIFCGASRCTHRVGVHFSHVRTKLYVRLFAFDVSGMLWALVSTIPVVGLCLLMGRLCDLMGLSEILMGKGSRLIK